MTHLTKEEAAELARLSQEVGSGLISLAERILEAENAIQRASEALQTVDVSLKSLKLAWTALGGATVEPAEVKQIEAKG